MCSTCHSKERKGGNGSLQYKFGSSFLGSNVLESDPDFNLEYMDLDEFLQENGIPLVDEELADLAHSDSPMQYRSPQQLRHSSAVQQLSPIQVAHQPQSTIIMTTPPSSPHTSSTSSSSSSSSPQPQAPHSTAAWWSSSPPVSPVIAEVPFTISPQDLQLVTIPGQDEFDPRKRIFSEEELKPQPLIKKSKKVFVVDELKDDKYWSRRNKNNTAAKRSRNARRLKENQIAMRAAFLEKENSIMKEQMDTMILENSQLKQQLLKYECHTVAN